MPARRHVLIVEDSPEDREATIRAIRKIDPNTTVASCATGDEALDYLFRRGIHEGRGDEAPALILLDLNLPGTDGRGVVAEIRQSEDYQTIPVVILTTSRAASDVRSCYAAGANSFVQKPVNAEQFATAIRTIHRYWFDVAVLP